MKVDELRVLEGDELSGRLKTARRELYELRFKHAVGQLENSSEIKKVRHNIARIMTVLSERELGIIPMLEPPPAVGEVPAAKPKRPARKEFVDEEEVQADAGEPQPPVEAVAAQPATEPEPAAKPKRGRKAKSEQES